MYENFKINIVPSLIRLLLLDKQLSKQHISHHKHTSYFAQFLKLQFSTRLYEVYTNSQKNRNLNLFEAHI